MEKGIFFCLGNKNVLEKSVVIDGVGEDPGVPAIYGIFNRSCCQVSADSRTGAGTRFTTRQYDDGYFGRLSYPGRSAVKRRFLLSRTIPRSCK